MVERCRTPQDNFKRGMKMKKDKYDEYKPEVFKYEDEDFTPGLFFGVVASVLMMLGMMILFVMFVMSIFGAVGWMI